MCVNFCRQLTLASTFRGVLLSFAVLYAASLPGDTFHPTTHPRGRPQGDAGLDGNESPLGKSPTQSAHSAAWQSG